MASMIPKNCGYCDWRNSETLHCDLLHTPVGNCGTCKDWKPKLIHIMYGCTFGDWIGETDYGEKMRRRNSEGNM